MPVSGICTSRFGCKKVLIGTVSAIALLLPLLVLATSPSALAITLVLYGISIGTTGCTMNIQAISVEKAANKPLMSGFHGFYSLGGMMGAFVLTLLLTAGITPLAATGITSSLIMALLILSTPGYSTQVVSHSGPYFAMPRGPVFIIGVVCFVFFLAEGTVLDWSGIFLNEYRAVPASAAGMGIVFFSIAMTMGRLLGDGIVARLGARVVVTLGSLIAISGFLISLSLPYWQTALLGYALIGVGCSNIVPIMFSAAGKQNVMTGPLAITAVSSLGYIGVLSGPAIVGFGAEIAGLPAALYGVVLLVVLALLLSKRVRLTQAA
ncbi:Inner membrane protein YbjJ [compost metagenome]